jgi:hypothetical protein
MSKAKPKSWARDEEHPELLVPLPAFDQEHPQSEVAEKKFDKRKKDFLEEQQLKKKIALDKREQKLDEQLFDDDRGIELDAEHSDEEAEQPVVKRDFANDAIRYDYKTGKTVLTRELTPRHFNDYNMFRPDDTVVLNGMRRTGKSFMMRSILYEMRHMFAAGLVFTATKHNGTTLLTQQRPGVLRVCSMCEPPECDLFETQSFSWL